MGFDKLEDALAYLAKHGEKFGVSRGYVFLLEQVREAAKSANNQIDSVKGRLESFDKEIDQRYKSLPDEVKKCYSETEGSETDPRDSSRERFELILEMMDARSRLENELDGYSNTLACSENVEIHGEDILTDLNKCLKLEDEVEFLKNANKTSIPTYNLVKHIISNFPIKIAIIRQYEMEKVFNVSKKRNTFPKPKRPVSVSIDLVNRLKNAVESKYAQVPSEFGEFLKLCEYESDISYQNFIENLEKLNKETINDIKKCEENKDQINTLRNEINSKVIEFKQYLLDALA